jgi:signal transduction histidine kinase
MTGSVRLGLRVRLVWLVAFAVLPAIALTVYAGLVERRDARDRAVERSRAIVSLISSDLDRLTEGSRQLLEAIAILPPVRALDGDECSDLVEQLLSTNPRYTNIGAVRTDGSVFCSAVPFTPPVTAADRSWFKEARATGRFAVGDFQVGRITRKAALNFGLPFRASNGRQGGVVFAALDLAYLRVIPSEARLPADSSLAVIDRNGLLLFREPPIANSVGKPFPSEPLVRAIITGRSGALETPGLDGRTRLYSFTGLGGAENAYVTVGVPIETVTATADAALIRNLVTLAVIALLAFAAALVLGDRLVARPIEDALVLQQQAAAREHEANEQLRQADAIKNTFLAAVSHDIRNPIAVIRGFAELLETMTFTDEERLDILRRIGMNARKLERLTEDMMDLERLSRGMVEPQRAPTELRALAQRIVSEVDARGHPITVDGEEVTANVDRAQVERIIENLVRNAVKYTPAGEPVDVGVARENGAVVITVDDRGPGVPDAIKSDIFEAFRRREGETASGMGIGLFLVSRFAALHGGRAWVEDRPGGGSRFHVSLADS